ncbi:sugar phosphate permease [Nocardioides aurantiacus]|uniref:Sugar phosphate permease n=1 Tax=Nocardioides aurantiacus TaxID=86796 RepID=A0A3N2CUJ9_9ACTN|nr:sugar phosphate permease [Nocardioides aurantiacus]
MISSRLRPTPVNAKLYLYVALSNTLLHQGIFILYLIDLGFSAFEVSVLQALLFVSVSVASVPVGLLVDRIGARAAAALGQVIIATILFSQVFGPSSFWFFLILFFAHGVGLTFRDNSELVILYETAERSGQGAETAFPVLRSRCTAIRAATVSIAIIIGGFIQPFSWTLVYVISGTAAALAGVLATVLLPAPSAAAEKAAGKGDTDDEVAVSRWQVLESMGGGWALLLVVSSLMHGTLTPFLIFSQTILKDQSVSTPAIAVTMAGVYTLGVIAPLLAPRAMRRFPTMFLAGSTLTLLTAGLILASLGVGPITIAVVLIAASVPEVTAIALDFSIQDEMPADNRGTLTGVVTLLESTVIGAAYLGFGAVAVALGSTGSAGAFAALPFLALLIVVVAWLVKPAMVRKLDTDGESDETIHHDSVVETKL